MGYQVKNLDKCLDGSYFFLLITSGEKGITISICCWLLGLVLINVVAFGRLYPLIK